MNRHRLLWLAGAAYLATWIFISWLTLPSLDAYGDMVENYAWSQAWAWGTFKHPPLFPWIVGAWFTVMPTKTWAYFALSYVNGGFPPVSSCERKVPGQPGPNAQRS